MIQDLFEDVKEIFIPICDKIVDIMEVLCNIKMPIHVKIWIQCLQRILIIIDQIVLQI